MSQGLQWRTSNRLETLSLHLARVVQGSLHDPFAEEIIVVQSLGMARWLQLELARLNGICSRIRFPFPQSFLREICQVVVPEAGVDQRFTLETLTWRIWELWPSDGTAFADPLHYIGGDPRRRFQLARRVAGLFDQYFVYRPHLPARWAAGEEEGSWQAPLWRALDATGTGWPESRLLTTAIQRMKAGPLSGLPERVSVFGISALPPLYLQFLTTLGTQTEVTVYQLQPCREYWGDTVSRREEQRALKRMNRRPNEGEALNFARGHRLLTSLGRLGRSFQDQMAEQGGGAEEESSFIEPGTDSLLHCLQSDLLQLADRTANEGEDGRITLRLDDASLRIHSCHSPRRELEVLYDQLLDAFEADPSLMPRDVLVLAPDLEAYAPLIQAVFGTPEDERLRFPFTIADRVPRAEGGLAESFLHLLRLPGGRFGRSELLPLLEEPAVQQRLGLAPSDLPQVRQWLEELHVSWGLNAGQRGQLGSPAFPQGTWRHTADRMLLGYALAPQDELVLEGVSPFPEVEGDTAALAGRFAAFVALMEGLPLRLAEPRSLPTWADDLGTLLDDVFAPNHAGEAELAFLRETLGRLRQVGRAAALTEPAPLAAVVEQLDPWLAEERRAGGFLRGGITFAALQPMRSVPARVMAVLGLDDGAFPRRPTPLSFDLIAAHPQPGDEARESDDRYLFLETLISARDRLHLSYLGRSLRDNADLPPSVVLSELLDHLAAMAREGAAEVKAKVLVKHPLHAFSPDYFGASTDPRLFSYSRENSHAAGATHQDLTTPEPDAAFCPTLLPPPDETENEVDLADLASFLANPARAFLRRRLGIRLPEAGAVPDDRELFTVDSLAAFRLKQEWLERLRRCTPATPLAERRMAEGRLPLGPAGPLRAREIETAVRQVLSQVPEDDWEPQPPIPFNLNVGEYVLSGTLDLLTVNGLCLIRPAKFKAAELLRLWLNQLVLSAMRNERPPPARLTTEDESWSVSAPEDPPAVLVDLLALQADGLRRPLRFFPTSAWAFATAPDADALDRALKEWNSSGERRGESADAAFEFCFGAIQPHPLDEEFEMLARRICGPLAGVAQKRKAGS